VEETVEACTVSENLGWTWWNEVKQQAKDLEG